MNESVEARLVIELYVECPDCEHDFDLFKTPDNDEGWLHKKVMSDAAWKIDADERIDITVACPECKIKFRVKGVAW